MQAREAAEEEVQRLTATHAAELDALEDANLRGINAQAARAHELGTRILTPTPNPHPHPHPHPHPSPNQQRERSAHDGAAVYDAAAAAREAALAATVQRAVRRIAAGK